MTVKLYEGCWGVTRGGEKRGRRPLGAPPLRHMAGTGRSLWRLRAGQLSGRMAMQWG